MLDGHRYWVASVVSILVVGCSSGAANDDGSRSDAISGAAGFEATAEGGAPSADGAAGIGDWVASGAAACNTVINTAPLTNETNIAADPPAPRGGVPVPGTYFLTAWNHYTGPGGAAGKMTIVLQETLEVSVEATGVVTLQIAENDGPNTAPVFQTAELTIMGTMALQSFTCPFMGTGTAGITSSANSFSEVGGTPDGPEEWVFTKQ
jgi:hypothetical protein